MSKSTPSLLALLGLVAVAGYQNRGRITEMVDGARRRQSANGDAPPAQGIGFLAEIGDLFNQGRSGATLSTGLADLMDRFRSTGRGAAAESWVSQEPNMPIDVDALATALGSETLAELSQKTGLPTAELLVRLNTALPETVNRFTPDGRLPTEAEAQALA